jgi:hypothetical protein
VRGADVDELEHATGVEAICAGDLANWALRLAEQAAVAAEAGSQSSVATVSPPPRPPAVGVLAIGPDAWPLSVARLAGLAEAFDAFVRAAVSADAVAREIALRRSEWLRFRGRALTFAGEGAVREALLCVRDDGCSPAEIERRARPATAMLDMLLDEAQPAFRRDLLSCLPGDVLRIPGDEPTLLVIDAKLPARSDDPIVYKRATADLIKRAVVDIVDRRVRWHERP